MRTTSKRAATKQENRYTPPILAGGVLFFGGTDGGVRAVDAASGALRLGSLDRRPHLHAPSLASGPSLRGLRRWPHLRV